MAQNTIAIADGSGATVLTEINAANQTLASNFSGAASPTSPVAYQLWADTTAGKMKQRNAANTAWVDVWDLTVGIVTSTFRSSASPTMSAGMGYVVSHGLGVVPTYFAAVMRCNTADAGYAIADEVILTTDSAALNYTIYATSTQVAFIMGAAGLSINNKGTYAATAVTLSSWNIYLRAIK